MELDINDIPKFTYTQQIGNLYMSLETKLYDLNGIDNRRIRSKLRKISKLHSINSSLAIESNGLTLETMQDVIEGKLVEGPFDEVLEAKNASNAYNLIKTTDIFSIQGFLSVEEILMFGLVPENGFRTGKVGVSDGTDWVYIAPPASEVPLMMEKLLNWAKKSGYPGYIVGAIVHFYIEMIHPLRDGNGRIGRLWHNEIMSRYNRTFDLVSIENLIYLHQDEYYRILSEGQEDMDCTEFCRFCLGLLNAELGRMSLLTDPHIAKLLSVMDSKFRSSTEIMSRLDLKSRPYFLKNYLRPALNSGFVEMSDPEHPNSPKQKYRSLLRTP